MFKAKFLVFAVLLFALSAVFAADWPQFRGPERDGRSPETGLLRTWPQGGPPLLWTAQGLGEGWSSAAIAGRRVYVTGMEKKREFMVSLDLTGQRVWCREYGGAWTKSFPGARTTPTVDGDRVYAISGSGEVVCLQAADGEIIWSVAARDKFQGKTGIWGTAESPLVHEDKVFYTPCGDQTVVVALDKMTGDTLWTSPALSDQSAYVSPILIDHRGQKQLITVTGRYIIGVDSASGALRWSYPYAEKHATAEMKRLQINAISPLYRDGDILVTSGYDHVAVMLHLADDGRSVSFKWENKTLDSHHGGVIFDRGYLYGSNWESNSSGKWMCLDWESGEGRYETSWNDNKGPLVYADGMLYCGDEDDFRLGLVKATPQGFAPVSVIEEIPGKGKFWAHPSIADGRLYLRHGEYLLAYDIRAK